MKNRVAALRRNIAAVIAIIAPLAGTTTWAQPVFLNPPCTTVDLINNSPCYAARVEFVESVGLWVPASVLPTSSTPLPMIPGVPLTVSGVISLNGNFYPFNPPNPTLGVNCGTGMWWIEGVTLGPPPGCCYDICADPATCTIWLNRHVNPSPCNP